MFAQEGRISPEGVSPFDHLDNSYVRSLRAFLALDDVELDPLALLKRAESLLLDGGVVDENVLSAVSRNEAITLCVIEPLYGSRFFFFHFLLLLTVASWISQTKRDPRY
jgi:hypothetical protein